MTTPTDNNYFCVKGTPRGLYTGQAHAYLAISKTSSQSPLQWKILAATSPEGLGLLVAQHLNGNKLNFGNQVGSNSAFLTSPENTPVHYHLTPLTPEERRRVETEQEQRSHA